MFIYLSFTELKIYLFLWKPESQWAGPPTSGIICRHSWEIRRMLPALLQPWLLETTCFTCRLWSWLFRKHIKKKIKGPRSFKHGETPAASMGIPASFLWRGHLGSFHVVVTSSSSSPVPSIPVCPGHSPGYKQGMALHSSHWGCLQQQGPQEASCSSWWLLTLVLNHSLNLTGETETLRSQTWFCSFTQDKIHQLACFRECLSKTFSYVYNELNISTETQTEISTQIK